MTLDEIRTQFAKDAAPGRAARSGSFNSFGAFINKKDEYILVGKWVCHGWLGEGTLRSRGWGDGGLKYMLSAVMAPHMDKNYVPVFIDWLVNRSPWRDVFVDKNVESILKYGYLVNADFPTRFITSAMIASRFPTESYSGDTFEKRCLVWRELLDMGCTESEAFIFAHMYDSKNTTTLYPITASRVSSGHSTFGGFGYQEDYVRNFLNANPSDITGHKLSSGRGYANDSICNIWGRSYDGDHFWTKVQKIVPRSRNQGVDHNIFRQLVAKTYSYKNREDFASVITQLREMLNK